MTSFDFCPPEFWIGPVVSYDFSSSSQYHESLKFCPSVFSSAESYTKRHRLSCLEEGFTVLNRAVGKDFFSCHKKPLRRHDAPVTKNSKFLFRSLPRVSELVPQFLTSHRNFPENVIRLLVLVCVNLRFWAHQSQEKIIFYCFLRSLFLQLKRTK